MKIYIATAILILAAASGANAQSSECPPSMVCISAEAARQALRDSDTVKAQDAEIVVLKQAVADQRKITDDIKLELAKTVGEKTGSEQMVVRLTAIIDFMLKNGRTKKYGVINF